MMRTFSIMNITPARKNVSTFKATLCVLLFSGFYACAVDYTWTGGGSNNNWSNTDNWDVGGSVPDDATDLAIFSGGVGTVNLDSDYNVNVDFQTAGWTLGGSNTLSFDNLTSLTTSASSGTVNISANLAWNNTNLNINNSTQLYVTGGLDVSGNQSISDSTGTVILNPSSSSGTKPAVRMNVGTLLFNNSTPALDTHMQTDTGVIGGNGTITTSAQVRTRAVGGSINPGGNGTTEGGSIIGDLSIVFNITNTGVGVNRVRLTDGSALHIDIDTIANTSDLLDISLGGDATDGGKISFGSINNSAILELSTIGGLDLDPGDQFTISNYVVKPTSDNGDLATFGIVTLNGLDITDDLGMGTYFLNYNDTSLVFGMVPEPSTYALISGMVILTSAFIVRKRKS